MKYRVVYGPSFREDVRQHVRFLKNEQVSDVIIERWFTRLFELIDSLDEWPRRFPIDPAYDDGTGHKTHKANFGNYLVFYEIDEDARQVNVVAFMLGAKRR